MKIFFSPDMLYHPGPGDVSPSPYKPALVHEALLSSGLQFETVAPSAVTPEEVCLVHDPAYVAAVQTGRPLNLAESSFFSWSPQLARAVFCTSGAMAGAARSALHDGAAAALCSGFHHAKCGSGGGFCVFNGLVLALELLRREGLIQRALVVDGDAHLGDGTLQLLRERPWAQNVSAGTALAKRGRYLEHLQALMQEAYEKGRPDILLYQAGMDILEGDPLGGGLMPTECRARDLMVFRFCRDHKVPVAWNLAGGYQRAEDGSLSTKVIQGHMDTFRAAAAVFRSTGETGSATEKVGRRTD